MEVQQSKDYVDNIMAASQPLPSSKSLTSTSRKRHSSDSLESRSCKKLKDTTETESVFTSARRILYGQTPQKMNYIQSNDQQCLSASGIDTILSKLDLLSYEIKMVNSSLTERIDVLEKDLERKLTEKMSQSIDKRVNSEMKRVHKTIDERIDSLKADINNELDSMSGRLNSISDVIQSEGSNNRSMNLVFRKVPETVNENIEEKINMIIKDHMKVNDVKVSSANRVLNSNTESRTPGVVIATFGSEAQRSKILKSKKNLNNSIYKEVFVHEDQSKEERIAVSNLKTLVNAVNRGERISIRGNRVFRNNSQHSGTHNNGTNDNQMSRGNNAALNTNYNGANNANRFQSNNSNRSFRGSNHSVSSRGGQSQRGRSQRQHSSWRNQGRGNGH